MIGKTISHYKILEEIGRGGMGIIYKAEDIKLERIVALKFLPVELTRDAEAKERFMREARTASALDHLNICNIHEINETEDGRLFIVMAYYEGHTLALRIDSEPLEIEEALEITIQIARGLVKAHEQGIVHRDIKPANIIITRDSVAKIVDFGLAKLIMQTRLTQTGIAMGTAAYMSPEQVQGEQVDHRTDIWSLGIMLYEMLVGIFPFRAEHDMAVMYSIINNEPEPLTGLRTDAPRELEQIVSKSLAKKPDKRYQNANEMLTDLMAVQKRIENSELKLPTTFKMPSGKNAFFRYGGIAAFFALIIFVVLNYFSDKPDNSINSIAVLPLKNLSGDPAKEYFADGMTEALITELSKIKALRVISRTSIMRYKETDKLLPEIANELNVDAAAEGSVLLTGKKIRITVKLLEVTSERNLLVEQYDRDLQDILALQSDVAGAIAHKIKITMSPDEQARLVGVRNVDSEVYNAYLKGRFFINKWTEAELREGIAYFGQALEKDPNYAPAYAGLARAYEYLVWYGWISPAEGWPMVKAAAQKALQINEMLSEAHVMLAEKKCLYDYDWEGAENGYKRAIILNPGNVTAHLEYAWYLSARARHAEAFAGITRAKELDPLSSLVLRTSAWIFCRARKYDLAIKQAQEILHLEPNDAPTHSMLGSIYLFKFMYEKSIAEYQKAIMLWGNSNPEPALARAYALAGEKNKARKILGNLLIRSKQENISQYRIAKIYLSLGEIDKTLEWLENAYQKRDFRLIGLKVDPFWDSIRSDPGFGRLLKKIGL